MARSIRVVSYAVNGGGIGHIQRLIAINRWVKRYASFCGVNAEVFFLTSSEASHFLFHEGFAAFKIPSKTAVERAGIDKLAYIALAKQWIWHSAGLLRPELLIVDTFPNGTFGELLPILDLVKRRAFIYRPLKEEFAKRADFQALLPLYDLILVPDGEEEAASIFPPAVENALRFTGPIMVRERVELRPREEARKELGVKASDLCVYASAGGGGDASAEEQLLKAVKVLSTETAVHTVVGAGPLYRGREIHGPRVTWLSHGSLMEWMPAFDIAFTAAGYNSFFELMHAGVPSVFLPQEKIADEQDRRARRAAKAGAGVVLQGQLSKSRILEALHHFRDPETRGRAREAARNLVPSNNARTAAGELLMLVLAPHEVEAAEEAISDAWLEVATKTGVPLELFFDIHRSLDPEPFESGARRPLGPRRRDEARRAVSSTLRVVEEIAAAGIPASWASRIVPVLSKKILRGTLEERAGAIAGIIHAVAPFGDWNAALNLVRTINPEKEIPADSFAAMLSQFIDSLKTQGESLTRGIERLSKAQMESEDLPASRHVLRDLVTRATE